METVCAPSEGCNTEENVNREHDSAPGKVDKMPGANRSRKPGCLGGVLLFLSSHQGQWPLKGLLTLGFKKNYRSASA